MIRFLKTIFLLSVIFIISKCNENECTPKTITWDTFENSMLKNEEFYRIEIINELLVRIYIKNEEIEKYKTIISDYSECGIYQFSINYTEEFIRKYENAARMYGVSLIEPIAKTEKNYIDLILSYVLPFIILIMLIYWVYAIFRIANSYSGVIFKIKWIAIVTLIPIVGLIFFYTRIKRNLN